MNTSSPIIISSAVSSPTLYPASLDSPVSPLIFASAQEAVNNTTSNYESAPLPAYPFCNCPVHDTTRCTGPTDFPFCCEAHWAQESGNQAREPTPDSLPSLVTASDSEDSAMDESISTDLDDPLTSIHRTRDWLAQVRVNTTQISTHTGIEQDQPTQWGNFAEVSTNQQHPTDPRPIPTIETSDPPARYGTCWTCKMPNADHRRVNCPHKKPMHVKIDSPQPQTRKQRRADKKRPHKPTRIAQGPRGRQPAASLPAWRRRASSPHRFDQRTLLTIKKNTGQDLIALLQEYSVKMGRANFDIWNMRQQLIDEIVEHIKWQCTTGDTKVWGWNSSNRSNNGWGTTYA